MDAQQLSQRLGTLSRELRKDREVSQRALAEAVGTAQTKVSLLEHGKLDFSALAFVARIADYHGLSPVELLGSVFAEVEAEGAPGRPDRPWLVSASRVLSRIAARADSSDLLELQGGASLAELPLDRLVSRLVRRRAFGASASAEPAGWLLPFAPALMRRAVEDLGVLGADRGLAPGAREQAEAEIQRFALLHELAIRPMDALALVENLASEYAMPELEYLRGVLLHRIGESPLRVKGAIHRAIEALEAEDEGELRADLAVSGLLEYLVIAAEAADRPDYYLRDDPRVEHAISLLRLAGFSQGGVHVELRFAAMRHERLRALPVDHRDDAWRSSWEEVRRSFEGGCAEYESLGLSMGVAYAEDWLARHDELAGSFPEALARIEGVAARYRQLGRRRWECSAEIRAAFYRASLADPTSDAEGALTHARESCRRLEALLSEGPVPAHERPMIEEHLARAHGRIVILRRARGEDAGLLEESAKAYRFYRGAALEHYDEDVDVAAERLAVARGGFDSLEAEEPSLGGPR